VYWIHCGFLRQSGELEHPPQLIRSQLPLIERLLSAPTSGETGASLDDWLVGEANEPEPRGEAEAAGLRAEEGEAVGLLWGEILALACSPERRASNSSSGVALALGGVGEPLGACCVDAGLLLLLPDLERMPDNILSNSRIDAWLSGLSSAEGAGFFFCLGCFSSSLLSLSVSLSLSVPLSLAAECSSSECLPLGSK
jgi:hypothetical protein